MWEIMYKSWVRIALLLWGGMMSISGQEFKPSVQISVVQLPNADVELFRGLEEEVEVFLGSTKWTDVPFGEEERISIGVFINITGQSSANSYSGSMRINYSRPVYGSAYTSPVVVINDENVAFSYVRGEPLEFSGPHFISSNLVAILAFYAYVILGIDFDTYSLFGGTRYYQKAREITMNMQNTGDPGWTSNDKKERNRYWLITYILDPDFQPLRRFLYSYHREALDSMVFNPERAAGKVLITLGFLHEVHRVKPSNVWLQFIFEAKHEELAQIFAPLPPELKTSFLNTIQILDPAHQQTYIKGGRP